MMLGIETGEIGGHSYSMYFGIYGCCFRVTKNLTNFLFHSSFLLGKRSEEYSNPTFVNLSNYLIHRIQFRNIIKTITISYPM